MEIIENMEEKLMRNRIFCPACKNAKNKFCFNVNGYKIIRCLKCSSMYVENLPGVSEISSIYISDSYYELPADSIKRIQHENERRMKIINSIIPCGNFLDIGCAKGLLLNLAKQDGYVTFGIEPTAKNADSASVLGHSIFNGWLHDYVLQNPTSRFDVIACLDVIEHIDNPDSFLNLATSLLTRDGLMVISTPNYSGIIAKLLKSNDPYMTPPEHVTFFTLSGLIKLAENSGLRVERITNFGSLTPSEIDRSINRYIPKMLKFLAPFIRLSINSGFKMANLMRIGLEQEVYFRKI